MSAVVLLSCVKSKRDHPCKAGQMYASALFQKMMAYAQSLKPQATFILSAKYGLLRTDTVIELYEQTLKTMQSVEQERCVQAQTPISVIDEKSGNWGISLAHDLRQAPGQMMCMAIVERQQWAKATDDSKPIARPMSAAARRSSLGTTTATFHCP